jgi:SAM-dependent methyltransferase
MRHEGERRHGETGVRWIHDRLPGLEEVHRLGLSFDVILLNAVWMHVTPGDRPRAFRKLMSLLKPGGRLVITLRHGPAAPERGMHDVDTGEIGALARDHGAFVERQVTAPEGMGRPEVNWTQLVVRLPDDGTGALPLLRHIILNDEKASTYKLGLLRALCRIADGSAGMARSVGDEHVAVPLGLVGLYWLRLFKPLLEAGLPQSPVNHGLDRLGFVREGFRDLGDVSHLDLRVSARFESLTRNEFGDVRFLRADG